MKVRHKRGGGDRQMTKGEDREDREIAKEKMSPERDITPLLGSKLPQL